MITSSFIVIKIIRGEAGDNFDKIIFKKSERIYKLAKNSNSQYLILLKESLTKNTLVTIKRANEQSDVILVVEN